MTLRAFWLSGVDCRFSLGGAAPLKGRCLDPGEGYLVGQTVNSVLNCGELGSDGLDVFDVECEHEPECCCEQHPHQDWNENLHLPNATPRTAPEEGHLSDSWNIFSGRPGITFPPKWPDMPPGWRIINQAAAAANPHRKAQPHV